uniref:CCHC-type domain-containing protein n=1 Tax=Photinus pyralis TaxID=7054 RepID=A0A1Y1KHS9_PHOPY
MPTAICGVCRVDLNRTDKVILCASWCQTYFHTKCVKVSDDEVKFINSKKNFNWFCDPCAIHESHSLRNILTNINKVTMNWDRVMESQHEKLMNHEKLLKDTLDQVNTQNVSISKDLAQVLQTQSEVKLTYADKLKQKTYDPVIIVKPKDANQPSKQTFTTLKENIDPITREVTGMKTLRRGTIVVECKNKEAAAKLKEEAETKLGSDYILSLPKQKMPKIKIVGLNDKIGSTQMKEMILAQNQFLDEAAYINVVHITEDKRNPNRYLAYAEVDGNSYRKILSEQKLNIGWDRCRIYDAVTTRRCYKCNGFGHKATDCSKTTTCPKCAGDHDLASCKASDAEIKCSNCANAVEKLKMKLDVQHPAWSVDCPVYKKRLDQERSRIDFLGHPQH